MASKHRHRGTNAHIDFPKCGIHKWTHWGQQLLAMKPDVVAYLQSH
ncbi:S-formylglutathione hydrolase FrmB [Mycobacteroides chelonae]|nr:S-formylglutathione hydrolase FrmB [Mycobacteroides chelonae]